MFALNMHNEDLFILLLHLFFFLFVCFKKPLRNMQLTFLYVQAYILFSENLVYIAWHH